MTSARGGRRAGDPIANFTLFLDHPEAEDHPTVEEVMVALEGMYPHERFRIEHRAMSVEGSAHILFDVYHAHAEERTAAAPVRRSSDGRWPL